MCCPASESPFNVLSSLPLIMMTSARIIMMIVARIVVRDSFASIVPTQGKKSNMLICYRHYASELFPEKVQRRHHETCSIVHHNFPVIVLGTGTSGSLAAAVAAAGPRWRHPPFGRASPRATQPRPPAALVSQFESWQVPGIQQGPATVTAGEASSHASP